MRIPDAVSDPFRARRRRLALLALAPVVLLAGCEAKAPPQAEAKPPPGVLQLTQEQFAGVKFATVSSQPFDGSVETDGKIATDDDVTTQVFSPVSGRVTQVFVKAGDHVRAGAPLMAVEASEAAQGASDLATAVGAANAAKVQLRQAADTQARQAILFKENSISRRDLEQADSDLAAAQGAARTADAALELARGKLRILGHSDAEIRALEERGAPGAGYVVRAPIAGVVLQRQVGVGQYLNSAANGASNPVFVISDLAKVWLSANLREGDAAAASVGQTLHVRVPALPDADLSGRVVFVAPTVDPATRRVAVRAVIDNPGERLKPEMLASFRLVTASAAAPSAAVPEAAVIYEAATARVWVLGADRRVALRPVTTGRASGGLVEITSGLKPGEQVLTQGALFIDRAAQSD